MNVTIFIALKSFEAKQLPNLELCGLSQSRLEPKVYLREEGCLQRKDKVLRKNWLRAFIALPKKQSNYTVLRSPHIDKKSRDQFVMKVQKRLIIVRTEIKELRKKLFNLKFHADAPGVQMKVIFQTKTRLNSSCV